MAAAALLRSVASKSKTMSRAAAPTHDRFLVARGRHGGARWGPAVDVIQQGTADVLVSARMAAAATGGLRSGGAGSLTTKIAHTHAPPPPPMHLYHRLVHGRGLHSRTSPDPSTPPKVLDTNSALHKATVAALVWGSILMFGVGTYMHFWANPALKELAAKLEDLHKKNPHLFNNQNTDASSVSHQTPTAPASAGHGNTTDKGTGVIDKLGKEAAVKMMHSQENRVKELEATIMDLKAENAELKVALDSARSQGKA